jgi:hypothetical protein
MAIVREAAEVGNIRATVRKYKIYSGSLRYWIDHFDEMVEKSLKLPGAHTVTEGHGKSFPAVEAILKQWVIDMHVKDVQLQSMDVLCKTFMLNRTPQYLNSPSHGHSVLRPVLSLVHSLVHSLVSPELQRGV